MLQTIIIILVLWLLGLVTHVALGLANVLLALLIIAAIVWLIDRLRT